MRRSIFLAALISLSVLFLGLAATPAARADSVAVNVSGANTLITISGVYASNVPVTSFSSPNEAYSITFTVPTMPTPISTDTSNGTFGLDVSVAINGTTFASSEALFSDTLNGDAGGLVVCVGVSCDASVVNTFWDIAGSQLFTGTFMKPTFVNGTLTINGAVSGYVINGQPANGTFPFPNTTTPTPTPEPTSLFLLGLGILSIGAVVRKRLHAQ